MLASYYPPPWAQVLLWGSVTVLPLAATASVVWHFRAAMRGKARWGPLVMGCLWLALGAVMLFDRDFADLPFAIAPWWYAAHGGAGLAVGLLAISHTAGPPRPNEAGTNGGPGNGDRPADDRRLRGRRSRSDSKGNGSLGKS